jgi:23S rRNA (pseudouridine1915-N3)-methyltransferase
VKVRVVWVGKTKAGGLAAATKDLVGRIERLTSFEVAELRQVRDADDTRRSRTEGERILSAISKDECVIALDADGKHLSSAELAAFLGRHQSSDSRNVVFVVVGPAGLSAAVRQRSDLIWALSRFTFSHDMARVVLLEQIYRGFSILHNLPYAR